MNILLGIDIGTTKLCAIALNADSGEVITVRSAVNDASTACDFDASEQNATKIADRTIGLIRDIVGAIENPDCIAGIGVTGQMHGVLLIAEDGQPITPLINWQDQRGNRKSSSGRTFCERVRARIGDELLARTGTNPATGYGAVTLLRMAENNEIPPNATALAIHDFIVRNLTGISITDPTDAASWGIYDVQDESGWLPDIEKNLGLPIGLLPQIHETGSIAGKLSKEIAAETGLPDGIPVSVALGDNQASFIGSVPSAAQSVLFNIGTGGQMSVVSDEYTICNGLDTRPLVSGKWLHVGASLCGGSAFKILATLFSRVGADLFGQNASPESLYNKMTSLAGSICDDNCPSIAPYFFGTRIDASRTATISGLRDSNFTPAHLSNAMIRGMVDELISYYEISRTDKPQPRFIVGSGNGLRRNAVLRRELYSCFGSEILLPPNEEEAAVGAALATGVGIGFFSNWESAGQKLYVNSNFGG